MGTFLLFELLSPALFCGFSVLRRNHCGIYELLGKGRES